MIRNIGCLVLVSLGLSATALGEPEFHPVRVVRPFPVIKDAAVVENGRSQEFVRDEELVLGVALGGVSRAYPINQLTQPTREIINDRLGGNAIAATW